ncbi:zinc finger BED domain-containing protein 5-like [Macrobrachium rosenbergii]|uniref:zinc finger BED domain-containing protein 5-like n=1 Tax=Macrobrachium rosenbergii TaxID=79674 RepID=UPI0034D5343B
MFAEINSLDISMQGRDRTLVGLSEKLSAFKGKLKLWMNKIKAGVSASFPSLNVFLEDEDFSLNQNIIVQHISKLITEFGHYISENANKYSWIRNPFDIEAEYLPEETANISKIQEQLIEIQYDETLHYNFKRQALSSFWVECKRAFSKLKIVKTRLRNSMPEENLESYTLLPTEKEMLDELDTEVIINRFAQSSCELKRLLLI